MSAEPKQGFARGLAFQGISQIAQSAITLLLMPLVIKQAGAGPYGSYVVLSSVITLTTILCSLGAGFKARRNLPSASDAMARAACFLPSASFQLLTSGASIVILLVALPLLQRHVFRGEIGLQPVTIVLAVIALYTNNLADDYFRYTHQIPKLSKAIIIRSLLHPALVLAAPLFHFPLTADTLILAQAAAYLAVSSVLWWIIHQEIPLKFCLDDRAQHRADIALGFPLITAVLVENLLAAADRYILAALLSPLAVGAYAAACAIGALVLLLPRVANSALLPALSHAVDAGRTEDARKMLGNFLQVFLMLALPFIAGGILLGKPLLTILANAEVAALAHWVVPLTAVGGTLYGVSYLMFNALFVERKTSGWFKANATAAIVSLVFNVILVGWFRRIEAAAFVSVLSYAICLFIVRRSVGAWRLPLDYGLLGKSALAAGGMSLVLAGAIRLPLTFSIQVWSVALLAVAGAGAYFALLRLFGGWNPMQFRRALGL